MASRSGAHPGSARSTSCHFSTSMSGGGVGGTVSVCAGDPHAADVADERGPVVQVGDVMRGVAGRVGDLERAVEQASRHPVRTRRFALRARAPSRPTAGPCPRRRAGAALSSSRAGSIRCGAPRSCTYTSRSGQRSTSEPLAPAWSRWMWVSSSARGRSSPSASSSVGRHEPGPGSISTSPTCQQPITRGRPRCMSSMILIGLGCGCSGSGRVSSSRGSAENSLR